MAIKVNKEFVMVKDLKSVPQGYFAEFRWAKQPNGWVDVVSKDAFWVRISGLTCWLCEDEHYGDVLVKFYEKKAPSHIKKHLDFRGKPRRVALRRPKEPVEDKK